MTPRQAQIALEFLKRTDLKGAEVSAFMDVAMALRQIADNPDPGSTDGAVLGQVSPPPAA